MSAEQAERKMFPQVAVHNKVLWVNPNFDLPFRLVEGESTNLGMFVVDPTSGTREGLKLGVDPIHGRSSFLGRIEVADKKGEHYRDFDLKGNGYIDGKKRADSPLKVSPISIRDENSTNGIWTYNKALRETEITEELSKQSVRTARIGAIIGLEEIAFPDGTKISVAQAKEQELIHPEHIPVIGLRVFHNRERLQNLYPNTQEVLSESKLIAEKELGKEISWQEYLIWFATTMGQGLAGIHNTGYWHGSIDPHNVTLGAEIVDFGLDAYQSPRKRLSELDNVMRHRYLSQDWEHSYIKLKEIFGAVRWVMKNEEELIVGTNYGKFFYDAYIETRDTHDSPVEIPASTWSKNSKAFQTSKKDRLSTFFKRK